MGNGRPFGSLDEMNATIIKNWNSKVSYNDDVYVLGDVFWGMNSNQIKDFMGKLNGRKHLILGNHDRVIPNQKSNSWYEICKYKELEYQNHCIVLFHFPIFEWSGYYYNSYHFYGHVHNTMDLRDFVKYRDKKNFNCWDVGVDNNGFSPVSFEEICEKLKKTEKSA